MDDPNLQRLLSQLISSLKPEQVYLFGSRANGSHRTDSDYDMMVVVPDNSPAQHLSRVNAFHLIKNLNIDADVVPVRANTFNDRKDWPGTLSYEAMHHGVKLYERA